MVEAKDLRLGNYVNEDVLGNVTVHALSYNSCHLIKKFDSFSYSINFENLNPIILTRKALIYNCGFDYDGCDVGNVHRYQLNGVEIWCRKNKRTFYNYNISINGITGGTEIKNLHSLQNLFKLLSGKELELKDLA